MQFILPLGDSIVSLIATAIEALKSKLNIIITMNNKTITDMHDSCGQPTHAIGFQIDNEKEEIYDDE